jgi:glutamate N-acetyltransferase/amino-acid N-acetyltransferase
MLACSTQQVLPLSTGVIMEPLPVERIVAALPAAKSALAPDGWFSAVSAIMTTDTVPKGASRRIAVDGVPVTVTGIAKGSGMIHPDMATMLALIATDAPICAEVLAAVVPEIANRSFNCATVDGDTSTNDSLVVAATGKAPIPAVVEMGDPRLPPIRAALDAVATELAQAIVRDGEGRPSSRSRSRKDATAPMPPHRARRRPLAARQDGVLRVDPNLGRIVCAIGNAAAPDLDVSKVSFWLDDVLVVQSGGRAPSYREEDGQRVMKEDEITIRIALDRGKATARVWTCDFSHAYVSINADYRS